jgi:hypothetical protein
MIGNQELLKFGLKENNMKRIKSLCINLTVDTNECILKLHDKRNNNKKCTFNKCKDYENAKKYLIGVENGKN